MTRIQTIALSASALALVAGVALAQDKTAARDGKAVFLENKCNTCHTVQVAGVEKRKAASAEAADAKADAKSDKKAPDLSGTGLERKPEWIAAYLMKTESIKGEKHTRKFRGPEADLKLVSSWLSSLKTKKK
jgi:mono/diheme cytochrome c family protein